MAEAQAKEHYGDKLVRTSLQYNCDRGECEGYESSSVFFKVVYHAKSLKLLGATVMSPTAGENISELGVAMKAGMKWNALATVMHSYPSYSFALQTMAAGVYYDELVKYKGFLNLLKSLGL